MKKIENIISTCNECKHFRAMQLEKGNTFFAAICNFSDDEKDYEYPNILLHNSTDSSLNYSITIPKNCPLQTYKP